MHYGHQRQDHTDDQFYDMHEADEGTVDRMLQDSPTSAAASSANQEIATPLIQDIATPLTQDRKRLFVTVFPFEEVSVR